jgi:hypothetical protein
MNRILSFDDDVKSATNYDALPPKGGIGDKLTRKILTGCFIALVPLLTIIGSVLIAFVKPLQTRLIPVVAGYAVSGLALYIVGKGRTVMATSGASKLSPCSGYADSDHPLVFLKKSEFWGGVVLASALPIFLYSSYHLRMTHSLVPPPATHLAVPEIVVPPVKFPTMKLQGIVCNGANSTALIDGYTLRVGEDLHGVQLVSVDPQGVTLEMNGATNWLKLK